MAAHLCDAVQPVCPYRQWTLSPPYALRLRLIRDGALFTKVIRTFVRTVFSWQRKKAKALGHRNVHTGSITMAQRFGSLLQLDPHANTWIPDGVFVEGEKGELFFVALPPPTEKDIATLCQRVAQRIARLCATDDNDEPLVDDDDAVIASVQACSPCVFSTPSTTIPATAPPFDSQFSLCLTSGILGLVSWIRLLRPTLLPMLQVCRQVEDDLRVYLTPIRGDHVVPE